MSREERLIASAVDNIHQEMHVDYVLKQLRVTTGIIKEQLEKDKKSWDEYYKKYSLTQYKEITDEHKMFSKISSDIDAAKENQANANDSNIVKLLQTSSKVENGDFQSI